MSGSASPNEPGEKADETDLVIIGGGISGLALALVAARNGIGVTLLEANDFGAGATANSLRILHGGLRYLQTFNLVRARRSIRARRALMRLAPEFIRPIECRIPLKKWGLRSKLPISAACVLSDLIGCDRNTGLSDSNRLPSASIFRSIRIESQGKQLPAAAWWDAVVTQPHRLVAQLVRCCAMHGVRVENHARVEELIIDDDETVSGVRYRRFAQGSLASLRSRVVIDVAGHGGRRFRSRVTALRPLFAWVGAANFLIDERSSDHWATGLRARERQGSSGEMQQPGKWRDFFFVPTPSGTLAGTTYVVCGLTAGSGQAAELAFDQLLDELNRARPSRPIDESDVSYMFWGRLPAGIGASGSASDRLLQRDVIVDGARQFGLGRYYRVQGVKLTTAFELAANVLPILRRHFQTTIPFAQSNRPADDAAVSATQGSALLADDPEELNRQLASMTQPELDNLVRHCVTIELALTLEDLLQRRLGLLPPDYPDEGLRNHLAERMAQLLGWDESRKATELADASLTVAAGPASRVSLTDADY